MRRKIKTGLKCRDNVIIEVHDAKTGKVIAREELHNLVTNDGFNMIRDFMNAGSALHLTHFALGTSTTAPTAASTTLGTEVFRAAFTSTSTAAAEMTITYVLGVGSANGNTLREAGLFTAAAAGTMYAATAISPIVKTASIYATFTWVLGWS